MLERVRTNTNKQAKQPSHHSKPEPPLPDIPEGATHAYTKQHQTTGLQCPYEGPFRIDSRVSRSVLKLEVGQFKDGQKRFEYRHLNDIKFAHPKSLVAPHQRPKLGRPAGTSAQSNGPSLTDAQAVSNPSNPSNHFPNPTAVALPVDMLPVNKQTSPVGGNFQPTSHATSIQEDRQRSSAAASGGPPSTQPFSRPVRTTRNQNPQYVDAMQWSHQPWSASPHEIASLNAAIGRMSRPEDMHG